MNTRLLEPVETQNLAALNASGCNSVLLYLTGTGLEKGIIDATAPMRRMLSEEAVHDYSTQLQGMKEHGVKKPAIVLGSISNVATEVSLYRPKSKTHRGGDPRLWFSLFNRFAKEDDICAVFIHQRTIHVLNLTTSTVASDIRLGINSSAAQFISRLSKRNGSIAAELLVKLKALAGSPIKAVCKGDTAVGRSIEHALGISMNSSKKPDYRGIELKSGRSKLLGRATRPQLFGKTPDWTLSNLKSSQQILDKYGYERGKFLRLYCTVSTLKENSQGLQLSLDDAKSWLTEVSTAKGGEEICIWAMSTLHASLREKHNETFWIKAESKFVRSHEYFLLKSVNHTSIPSTDQFDRLLEEGSLTLDHTLKRPIPNGKFGDKGYNFKIDRHRIPELFVGPMASHSLGS
jgi:hypothetical protein